MLLALSSSLLLRTGNIDTDEIFYPIREKDQKDDFGTLLPYFGLGASWFMYLVAGYMPRVQSHFNPYEAIYNNHKMDCLISVSVGVGVCVWVCDVVETGVKAISRKCVTS